MADHMIKNYFTPRDERAHRKANAGQDVSDYCANCSREFMEHENGVCPDSSKARADLALVKP